MNIINLTFIIGLNTNASDIYTAKYFMKVKDILIQFTNKIVPISSSLWQCLSVVNKLQDIWIKKIL